MFETRDYPDKYTPELPADAVAHFEKARAALARQSQIVWGEHCSECAFPTCYSTCSFYTPRHDDLNCGRFLRGIREGRVAGLRLATIRFRKWGKLFGTGPVGLRAPAVAERREAISDVVSRTLIDYTPSLGIRWAEWKVNQWKIRGSAQDAARADAFIMEGWLPQSEGEFAFTLTIMPTEAGAEGFFQDSFRFVAGYNRLLVSTAAIAQRVDLSKPYSIQIEPFEASVGKTVTFGLLEFANLSMPLSEVRGTLARAAADAATAVAKAAAKGEPPKTKCVVWDLDNTVWCGTLAEDGLEGLELDPRVKPMLEELDRRGILISAASKNDPEPTFAALEAFGLREYFLYPQIGWDRKSDSIRRIAELLDIGLDTLVFIDDQPFERGEVTENLPQVTVLPETALADMLARPHFDVPATAESAGRRAMYMAEQVRRSTFEGSGGDYVEFLRGCSIRVEVARLSPHMIERAYELSQRTNQLNVSARRYTRDELQAMLNPAAASDALLFSCADRFGEYGMIALCVMSKRQARVESFMMSCRVQRKRVEQAIFQWLLDRTRHAGGAALGVDYRKTKRNDAAVRMLTEIGFAFAPQDAEVGVFTRRTDDPIPEADIARMIDTTIVAEVAHVA